MLDHRVATFLAVYRRRSFTQAGRELSLTQPAVSQHIRQIEAHYGCRLFCKSGRAVLPTPAADLLFRALNTAQNDETRLMAELKDLERTGNAADTGSRQLVFGCTRTVGDAAIPPIIARHAAAHPDDRISMRIDNTAQLVRQLEDGQIDFAVVEGSFDRTRFDSAPLSHEDYIAVAAPAIAATLPPDGRRALADLLTHRLVLREAGSGTREIFERLLAAHDHTVADFAGTIELGGMPAIVKAAAAGCGVAFLYRVAAEDALAAGTLVDVTPTDCRLTHDFCLIWQRGSRYAPRWRALARSWRSEGSA